MKEDDEVDDLDIKLDVKRKSKRVYQSPSPEVGLKISRSLKVSQLLPHRDICCIKINLVFNSLVDSPEGQQPVIGTAIRYILKRLWQIK